MEPSKKSHPIAAFLEDMAQRSTSIKNNRCVPPPFGCGGPATQFNDEFSRQEYSISGLCQECQNKAFDEENNW